MQARVVEGGSERGRGTGGGGGDGREGGEEVVNGDEYFRVR